MSRLDRFRGLLGPKSAAAADSSTLAEPCADGNRDALALAILRDFEDSGQGWFWASDADGRVTYISGSIAAKIGGAPESIIGQPLHATFVREREGEQSNERTLPLILSAHKSFANLVVRSVKSPEEEVWWSIWGRPRFSDGGVFLGYFGNGTDITASHTSQRDESRLASFDSLTGLANRHRISTRLDGTLTAYRKAKRSCALMLIDLDRFKQVNDTLGHLAGDELLKQVAERLQRVIDKGCEIGRLGGDEFQVILPDVDDRGKLGEVAKKVISILSQPYMLAGSRAVIGASLGIAIAPYDGIASEELIRAADLAMYAAKGGGRGQFRFYSPDLHEEAERRRRIEIDLRDALQNGQISLCYQPIVEPGSGKVVVLEALLCWEHPEYGEIPRSVFLPLAEDCDILRSLGDWALKQACEDASQWPGGVRVAVNVSPAQFAEREFPALIAQALAHADLAPERLELELTEAIFTQDAVRREEVFATLKILGVRLVADNFGLGNSSLAHGGTAQVDKIKIDPVLLRGITEPGSRNAAILRSMIGLAQELGMATAVEGIEAQDELALLAGMNVSQVSGAIFANPMGGADVLDAMISGEWVIDPSGPSRIRDERRTVFRRIGLIHEDYRYEVMMRNLSRSGCLIEGLIDVPTGTHFVIDFGEGQLAVATVVRSAGSLQGLEFEMPLVDDGAGGLVTRNRISPYVLAAAGMPLGALPRGSYPLALATAGARSDFNAPRFAQSDEGGRRGH